MTAELTPAGLRAIAESFRERHRPGSLRALMVAGSGIRLELPGWEAGDEIALADIFPFRLQELLMEDLPYIPLYVPMNLEGVRIDRFQGWVEMTGGIGNLWSFVQVKPAKK